MIKQKKHEFDPAKTIKLLLFAIYNLQFILCYDLFYRMYHNILDLPVPKLNWMKLCLC